MTRAKDQLRTDYKPSGNADADNTPRRPRVRRGFWLLLVLAVAGGGIVQLVISGPVSAGHNNHAVLVTASPLPTSSPVASVGNARTTPTSAPTSPDKPLATLGAETTALTVGRGDTLGKMFAKAHLSADDMRAILAVGGETARLKRIHPGQVIAVSHDDSGRILNLSMKLDDDHKLVVAKTANGYQASVVNIPTQTTVAYAHGVIENSLFDAATRAGLSDPVIMQLIHLFGWDIDFSHDIRSGDSFTVLYQKIHRQDEPVTDGPILAAEFVTPDKTYRIARFTDPSGNTDYYTPDGRSVRKELLRAPVAYTRISSGFSLHRMNPVLHIVRPHYGVDYAAPTGTPIVAAGDGYIVFRGQKEGFGRCIIIRHGGGYSTLYAHMSRFRSGLHIGSRVKQEQVIGYVGESGEATGPHLHYQIMVDGVPRNPRTVKLPSAEPLLAKYRPDFTRTLTTLLAEMSNGGVTRVASTNSSSTVKANTAH
ncbi:MAG: peptidoglycan DD-metalloendopeptidase family protein [Gammaproteobacteria bacterium]